MGNKRKQILEKQTVTRQQSFLYELTVSIVKKERIEHAYHHQDYLKTFMDRNFGVSYNRDVLIERVPIAFSELQEVTADLINRNFYYIEVEFYSQAGSQDKYYFAGRNLDEIKHILDVLNRV